MARQVLRVSQAQKVLRVSEDWMAQQVQRAGRSGYGLSRYRRYSGHGKRRRSAVYERPSARLMLAACDDVKQEGPRQGPLAGGDKDRRAHPRAARFLGGRRPGVKDQNLERVD